ncbi:hypothetical protein GCM10020219_038460 [Nonomuraea dietziae]
MGVPAYGICSLDAVAYGSGLNAGVPLWHRRQRKEVFWARYADLRNRLAGPFRRRPADVPVEGLPVVGVRGRGSTPTSSPDGRAAVSPMAGIHGRVWAARAAGGGRRAVRAQADLLRRPDAVVPKPTGKR